MATTEVTTTDELEVQDTTDGYGPLLERDYRASFVGKATPEDVMTAIRVHFPDFAPPETAVFRRCVDGCDPLRVGDEMDIHIKLLGMCKVRVVHLNPQSLTLRTLDGHPEAGRITFGAGLDDQGRTHFRILSRTRQGGFLPYLGYLLVGKQLQSRCWIKFISKLAETLNVEVFEKTVHVSTRKTRETRADRGERDAPTFKP